MMCKRDIVWSLIGIFAVVFSCWLLYRQVNDISLDELANSLHAIPVKGWLLAVGDEGVAILVLVIALARLRGRAKQLGSDAADQRADDGAFFTVAVRRHGSADSGTTRDTQRGALFGGGAGGDGQGQNRQQQQGTGHGRLQMLKLTGINAG